MTGFMLAAFTALVVVAVIEVVLVAWVIARDRADRRRSIEQVRRNLNTLRNHK